MTLFEQQGLAAVVLVVTALFVSGGMPISPKWRRRFKAAAISLFILGLVVVMAEIARWASSGGG